MKEQAKNKYSLYVNFESFMKMSKSGLSEVGEYTCVSDSKGKSKRVMVYSMFDLTDEEYKSALELMHEVCNKCGHSYESVNLICEQIVTNLDAWVLRRQVRREQREIRAYQAYERAMKKLDRMISNL